MTLTMYVTIYRILVHGHHAAADECRRKKRPYAKVTVRRLLVMKVIEDWYDHLDGPRVKDDRPLLRTMQALGNRLAEVNL